MRVWFEAAQERRFAWEQEAQLLTAPLVIFLALLPAINAPLDWLSLGVSRTLIRWTAGPGAEKPRGRVFEYVVILLDFALALVFAAGVVMLTAAGLALFDRLHVMGGGEGVFPALDVIARIRANPHAEEFWWLYLMMFWTLAPTFLHALTFVFSFVALAPEKLGWLRRLSETRALPLPLLMLLLRIVSLIVAALFLWLPLRIALELMNLAFGVDAQDFFLWLADMAEQIARFIGGA